MMDIRAAYLCYQNCMFVSFYQVRIHYCTAHKYSAETVINASRLINKFDYCYIYKIVQP